MRKGFILAAVMMAVSSLPAAVAANSITVHNTGVNGSDVVVALGAQASFWTLSAKPAGAAEALGSNPFRFHHPLYSADTSTAAWVSPGSDGNAGPIGTYTYDLVIDLSGLDPNTASVTGVFSTDNSGAIYLNGHAPVATTGSGSFGSTTAFTINSGFVPGLNTIHVDVSNEGDPTAFFVSFSSATAVSSTANNVPALALPALAALALLLAGLGARLARKS